VNFTLDDGPLIEFNGALRVLAPLDRDADLAQLAVTMSEEGVVFDVVEDGAVVVTMGMTWDEFADYLEVQA